MHDLVIRKGKVVDGSGAPAIEADVAIDGETIVAVGEVSSPGRREIDAGWCSPSVGTGSRSSSPARTVEYSAGSATLSATARIRAGLKL